MAWLEIMLLLNYKPVLHQPTGIGVYANAVLPVFEQFEHVLIPGGGSGGWKERLRRLAWSQVQLPRLARKQKANLIFTPAPEGYLGEQHVPQVVMVHDLRPLSHPDKSLQSIYFKNWVPHLLRQASFILTNSSFTANEICRATDINESKVLVSHLGYDKEHFCTSISGGCTQFTTAPYLLHIGQHYPHKNLERAIRAFASISSKHRLTEFWIVGKEHHSETPRLKRLVTELQMTKKGKFINYLPYAELPSIYSNAAALLYPSLWEGFGLPIIEAMACATPVITSIGSATEEIAGDAALLIDPMSVGCISSAIDQVLSDRYLSQKLIHLGLQRSNRFSWNAAKQSIVTAITSVS